MVQFSAVNQTSGFRVISRFWKDHFVNNILKFVQDSRLFLTSRCPLPAFVPYSPTSVHRPSSARLARTTWILKWKLCLRHSLSLLAMSDIVTGMSDIAIEKIDNGRENLVGIAKKRRRQRAMSPLKRSTYLDAQTMEGEDSCRVFETLQATKMPDLLTGQTTTEMDPHLGVSAQCFESFNLS